MGYKKTSFFSAFDTKIPFTAHSGALAVTYQRFNMGKKIEILNKHQIRYILICEGVYQDGLRSRMGAEEIAKAQEMVE